MEKYLNCKQIAEKYGVSHCTVWVWIREKKLPAIKIGKNYCIDPADLKKFEESRKTVNF